MKDQVTTRKGRVVYDRKTHPFSKKDFTRIGKAMPQVVYVPLTADEWADLMSDILTKIKNINQMVWKEWIEPWLTAEKAFDTKTTSATVTVAVDFSSILIERIDNSLEDK